MKNQTRKSGLKTKSFYSASAKPQSIPYTVYIQQLRAGKIEPVYILFGADHPGKNEFINELKATDDYKMETFVMSENEAIRNERLNSFLTKLFTPCLWGEKLLLVLQDFQNLSAAQQKDLLDRIKTIPQNYFAKVIIESKFHKELVSLFSNSKLPVMNFYALEERALVQYVYDLAKELGLVIDTESAKILIDLVGADFAVIHQELKKIKTFLGTKTRITQDVVLNACGLSKESSIEDLIKATFDRNRTMSLCYLYRLQKDRTFPAIIVSSLTNTGLSLLQIILGANRIMLGLGQKRYELLERQSYLWKQEELEKFILALARIDKKIKTGYPEPYVLLENLLVRTGRN